MGTNYYLHEKPDCECCGRPFEPLHIGKSSGGWCFTLHVIPEDRINTLEDWEHLWNKPRAVIRDEYGREIPRKRMKDIITNRSHPYSSTDDSWYEDNSAVRGPNNLARHAIGRFCIGHGVGTWDYVVGEFS